MEIEKAKQNIEEIFKLMGLPIESLEYSLNEKRGHIFSVKSNEFENLALTYETLNQDLVYLLKRMFNKGKLPSEEIKCTIDINDLQSKTDNKIKLKALNAAEEARNSKEDVLLEPMSSYERMLVHSTLTDSPDVATESVGEGRERRVKILFKV